MARLFEEMLGLIDGVLDVAAILGGDEGDGGVFQEGQFGIDVFAIFLHDLVLVHHLVRALQEKKKSTDEVVDEHQIMEKYREYVDAELPFLKYAPIAFITPKDGRNVQHAVD